MAIIFHLPRNTFPFLNEHRPFQKETNGSEKETLKVSADPQKQDFLFKMPQSNSVNSLTSS